MSDAEHEADAQSSLQSTNRYELIMIAAKEARRLNEYYRIRNVEPKSRITTEAIDHVRGRGTRYVYGARPAPELGDGDGAAGAENPSND